MVADFHFLRLTNGLLGGSLFIIKREAIQFLLVTLGWDIAGLYIDVWYKDYFVIPIQEALHPEYVLPRGNLAWCYLCITTAAAGPMV